MDQTTYDIRRANWLEIIQQCQQRSANTTVKQWCLDQGISEKSYYYWQRKFRKEAAEQLSVPDVPDTEFKTPSVTFAEVPFSYTADPDKASESDTVVPVHPTAVFKWNNLTVAVTNDISDSLLSRIFREISHA